MESEWRFHPKPEGSGFHTEDAVILQLFRTYAFFPFLSIPAFVVTQFIKRLLAMILVNLAHASFLRKYCYCYNLSCYGQDFEMADTAFC